MKTNKYSHVKSMKDLNSEILRLKLRKNVIKEELGYNMTDLKNSLSPINLVKEAIGFTGMRGNKMKFLQNKTNLLGGGKIFTYFKYLALTVSTIKGGSSLFRKIKRIFN